MCVRSMVQFVHTVPMHLQKWQRLFTIHVGSSAIGQPLLGAIHLLMERGTHTILLGVQNFLRGVFRDAVYPKDIWHGDALYPRIFFSGVAKNWGCQISYDIGYTV